MIELKDLKVFKTKTEDNLFFFFIVNFTSPSHFWFLSISLITILEILISTTEKPFRGSCHKKGKKNLEEHVEGFNLSNMNGK